MKGPFAVYLKDDGTQELKPLPRQGGGGSGTTIVNTSGGLPVLGIQVIDGSGGQVSAVKGRNLLVRLRLTTDGNVILPSLANADVGARITFVRETGAGVPRIVQSGLTDAVNASTVSTFRPYIMRSEQDSVTYLRVPEGWQREQGNPVAAVLESQTSPIDVPHGIEGTQYVLSDITGPGQITLPNVNLCRPGFRVVVYNAGDHATVEGTAGQRINGVIGGYHLPSGDSALFEVSGDPTSAWIAIAQNEDPAPITDDTASISVPAWRGFGRQVLRLTAPTHITQGVELPSVTDVRVGASILIENLGVGVGFIQPQLGEGINGYDYRYVYTGHSCLLVNSGDEWTATDGLVQPQEIRSSSDPLGIAAWVDAPQIVESQGGSGQVIGLPPAAAVPFGSYAIIWNSTADPHVITPSGAETINGGATLALPAGTVAQVWKRSANSWIAILGA